MEKKFLQKLSCSWIEIGNEKNGNEIESVIWTTAEMEFAVVPKELKGRHRRSLSSDAYAYT